MATTLSYSAKKPVPLCGGTGAGDLAIAQTQLKTAVSSMMSPASQASTACTGFSLTIVMGSEAAARDLQNIDTHDGVKKAIDDLSMPPTLVDQLKMVFTNTALTETETNTQVRVLIEAQIRETSRNLITGAVALRVGELLDTVHQKTVHKCAEHYKTELQRAGTAAAATKAAIESNAKTIVDFAAAQSANISQTEYRRTLHIES